MSCTRTWRRRAGRTALAAAMVWGILVGTLSPVTARAAEPPPAPDAGATAFGLSQVVGLVLDALGLGGEPVVPGAAPPQGAAPEDDDSGRSGGGLGPLIDPNGHRPGGGDPKQDPSRVR